MFGALPSRIARCSTGSARPSISRKRMPGTSVLDPLALAPGDPPGDPQRVGVVVVGAEDACRATVDAADGDTARRASA